jgi:6-phosphogluconolactonase
MIAPDPAVVVHQDAASVAGAAADRLVTRVREAQASGGTASLVLTGGGVGIGTLKALAEDARRSAVDWRRVELWWGDERFLPAGDPDRNDTQARAALLDHVDLDWSLVHPMAGPDGVDGDDPEAAAARYARDLLEAGRGEVPEFDVVMLGVGPEGHVASIFPESPAAYDEGVACAVRDCPKPPPTRVSMTFSTLNRGQEVWLLTAGAEKADAVSRALSGAAPDQVPAAGVRGRVGTWWMVDEAAASRLRKA